jgi:hypothetical protein
MQSFRVVHKIREKGVKEDNDLTVCDPFSTKKNIIIIWGNITQTLKFFFKKKGAKRFQTDKHAKRHLKTNDFTKLYH